MNNTTLTVRRDMRPVLAARRKAQLEVIRHWCRDAVVMLGYWAFLALTGAIIYIVAVAVMI